MTKSKRTALQAVPLWVWLLIFTLVPLALILFFAIFERTADGYRFTLDYLREVITNTDYLRSMLISFRHAFVSTLVCLLIGYPLAYFLTKMKPKARSFLVVLCLLPMWMNFLIRTYALRSLIERESLIDRFLVMLGLESGTLIGTDISIVIGMVYNFLPFLVLPIYTSLSKIDRGVIEASHDLGAGGFTTFRRVIFPLSVPGVISGITMVFMPAVTTFIIPQLLNNHVMTVGSLIEHKFKQEVSASAVSGTGAALSFVLMVLIIICMSVVNRMDKDPESNGGAAL